MIDQDKINNLVRDLSDTIQRLDKEEEEIGRQIERGVFTDQKTIDQKQRIRRGYRRKIQCYHYVLQRLGAIDELVREIWEKRKSQFTDNYSDLLK